MRIEVYNAVGGAAFFQGLLNEWRAGGAGVICHEAVSESAYRASRGPARRLALRWEMYAGYGWRCWWNARRAHPVDIRVVATNPFFAPALVARSGRGQGQTINLLYDLYPEALIQTGRISPESWLARRCASLTRFALQQCAATIFLGERLRAYTEAAHGPARRAVVIPVGADGAPFRDTPPQRLDPAVTPRILYSGQLGRMHDTATLPAAWKDGGTVPARLEWVFHASGSGYARLRQLAGSPANVRWGAALPEAEWLDVMRRAHVALVTMAPGAERVVMPSKTYSALVAGQAILAICPRNSDLADLVRRHDCGWVVEPGDMRALHQVLGRITGDAAGLWGKRCNAFEAGHRYYDVRPLAALWMKLMNELTEPARAAVASLATNEAAV